MTRRAYLIGRPIASGDAVVGGLSILLRQALSLQDNGIEELLLIGVSAAPLRGDARLRLTVREVPVSATGDTEPAIVAQAGCIWHPQIARRLARMSMAPTDVVAIGSGSAAIFACGRFRVREIVGALGGAGQLSGLGRALVAPRGPEFIFVPRTAAECRLATTRLLHSLYKPTDGIVSRHIHRRISLAITRRLLRFRITPNQMTIFAALVGVAGVLVAGRGGYGHVLAGAALFEAQNILDGCDGEISRLKYLRSQAGEWLDQVTDDVLNIAFLAAIGSGLAREGYDYARWLTTAAVTAQIVHLIGLYAGLVWKADRRGSVAVLRWWVGGGASGDSGSEVSRLRAKAARIIGDLTRRDFIAFAYLVTAALNVVQVIFVWHVAVTVASAVVTTVQWIAWGGPELQSGDEAATADTASELPA